MDAERLYAASSHWASFYLAGYALEFGLKARICRHHGVADYPTHSQFKVHDLATLGLLAGIQPGLDRNAALKANWSIATRWTVEMRYDLALSVSQADARDMLDALRARPDGLLVWLQRRW